MSKVNNLFVGIYNHDLDVEDFMFVEEYIEDVIADLKKLYSVDDEEAFQLLEGSAFIATLNNDPEYVVNHDTEYWAGRLYERKNVLKNNTN